MSTNKFVLFFTDATFRKKMLQQLKFRFMLLPGIRHVVSWWFAFTFVMKTKDLDRWQQHVARKNLERSAKQTTFICALIRLSGCISATDEYRDTNEFLLAKSEVLSCEYWREVPELFDLKAWIESIGPEERNNEPLQNFFEKYLNQHRP